MSLNLELEIKHLLSQEFSLQEVIIKLLQTAEEAGSQWTHPQTETLCQFLLRAEAPQMLIQFVLKQMTRFDFSIPWPYFLVALEKNITDKIAQSLQEGIQEEKAQLEASRSPALDDFFPHFRQHRRDRRIRAFKAYEQRKDDLLQQLQNLKLQNLVEKENEMLERLLRMFPGDPDISALKVDFRERNALEVISRRAPLKKIMIWDDDTKNPEFIKVREAWEKALFEKASFVPALASDLAIAAFMMELYETSLRILKLTPDSPSKLWFQLEVLLHTRRFLEALQEIARIELLMAEQPDTFFATAYYRAQALWGLGQKHLAIEVIEGLLLAQPHYRSAASLLSQWRGQ